MDNDIEKDIVLSIIIPAYNVESLITECIESLYSSSAGYEIIVVNDGSTDNTKVIAEKYQSEFFNLKVVNKANGGVSSARNAGLKEAVGEYVVFVDGDDFVEKESVSKAIEHLKDLKSNIDIIIFNTMTIDNDNKTVLMDYGFDKNIFSNGNKNDILNHISTLQKFPGLPHSKLIRREFLLDNHIFFNESYRNSEDVDWSISIFLCANTFSFEPLVFHYYRIQREGSLSNTLSSSGLVPMLSIIEEWVQKADSSVYMEYKKIIYSFLAYVYMIIMVNYSKVKDKCFNDKVRNYKWILDYASYNSVKLAAKSNKIVGFSLTCKLLHLYQIMRSR